MPSEINATIRSQLFLCSSLANSTAFVRSIAGLNICKPKKGVETEKIASRNKNVPHGRLLQVFCDLEGFAVDKSFIVDTVNQTEKTLIKHW